MVSLPVPETYKPGQVNEPEDCPCVFRWLTEVERGRLQGFPFEFPALEVGGIGIHPPRHGVRWDKEECKR